MSQDQEAEVVLYEKRERTAFVTMNRPQYRNAQNAKMTYALDAAYYRAVDDPFSMELLNRYERLYPGSAMFTAGSACTGTYRALKLWEAAVNEAGSLNQTDVITALDHARIANGPGGPAEMVPGQHHVRMNMYIARSEGGTFNVVKNLGHIDPKECEVGQI